MKPYLIGIFAISLVILLGGQAQTVNVQTPEALAKKIGCFECHNMNKNATSPTFHDIALRYKNKSNAGEALVERIKKGSKGNWTEITRGVPMPPYAGRLSDAEIRSLVDWVLAK